ncbi:penicillin-binding transpeptidase domain-containing protein [Bacillus sp. ISL-37]|uniref:transglycosylase domain-containing protein n=1 Tax=Bacillus sp. ISL-37 TaxID=2819123 RepID=UPI001BE952DE|nr:penicillin-binding transpeptidase domain-containing protein [Bacillus sp. ISL-37]MBT2685994.1 transglycosylase domain-containing protein [Bacillus sp. ISL-37]
MRKNKTDNGKKRKKAGVLLAGLLLLVVFTLFAGVWNFEKKLDHRQGIRFFDERGKELNIISNSDRSPDPIPKQILTIVDIDEDFDQELVKSIYPERETFSKIKRIFAKVYLNTFYNENEIESFFFKKMYIHNGLIGVDAAADYYFDKKVTDLELLEWLYILGVQELYTGKVTTLDKNIEMKIEQLVEVLLSKKLITENDADIAFSELPAFLDSLQDSKNAFLHSYLELAVKEAKEQLDISEHELAMNNIRLYINIDESIQKALYDEFTNPQNFPPDQYEENKIEGSMVIMDHVEGAVKAVAGSRNPLESLTNPAEIQRRPASAFKPLAVYAPSLEHGWKLDDLLEDKPLKLGTFTPKNYDFKYRSEVTMEDAIVMSHNVPAVWLMTKIGLDKGVESLKKFDLFAFNGREDYRIALGLHERGATPLQMAIAYSAFANEGQAVYGSTIYKMIDSNGEEIYIKASPEKKQIYSEKTANDIKKALTKVVEEGTGQSAKMKNVHVYGKTGTTGHDGWFVGGVDQFTVAVWVGTENEKSGEEQEVSGGTYPASLFKRVMEKVIE